MPKGKHGMGYLKDLTKEELYNMYHVEKISMHMIAARLNVTFGAIWYWMKKWDIPTRSHDDGIILAGKRKRWLRDNNPRWAGGRLLTRGGYYEVYMPYYPGASQRGYVKEHRYVWEQANGAIPAGWEVHHLNGIKTDNRIENLLAMPTKEHKEYIPTLQKHIQKLEEEIRNLK